MKNMGRVDKTQSIRVLAETSVRLKNLHNMMSPHGTMYGPTVRCKIYCRDGFTVLHHCIRPSCGALLLLAIMGMSAHSF
jgi:hypothetical protein